jgi:hypothetical protein
MEYGAIDLDTKRRQIRIVDAESTVVVARKIDTTHAALAQGFSARPGMRILIESSTESEWVAAWVTSADDAQAMNSTSTRGTRLPSFRRSAQSHGQGPEQARI